ncbi:MAG: hypothetical protein GQ531_02675 [Sulfurovum sp.]|nr:hypothetical protein [Sulfurovum sp.]
MKKLLLYLLILIIPIFLFSEDINSIEKLKFFMKEGQKNGYFPKTILLNTFGPQKKLTEVDIDFRTLIHWDIYAKCPSNEDEIILALGSQNHSIVCDAGDTAGILGTGDNWVDDATGNDIYYPGQGNDTIDTGSGSDIVIFDANWGQDKVTVRSRRVNTDVIMGYDGSYPWKYNTFIIFGKEIKREDIVWKKNRLYHLVTGDSIELNTKEVNVLFASDPAHNTREVPTQEDINLAELKSEYVLADGKYLYLAKGNKGMHVVNVKDPLNPVIISKLVLPGRTMDIVIENNIAYVAQGDHYLSGKKGWVSIVDISNKAAPKLLKTLKFGNAIRSVEVYDSKLYIADTHFSEGSRRKLHIYNVKQPPNPLLVFSSKLKFRMGNMVALDHKLYFLSTFDKIKVFDISNPKSPQLMKDSPLYGQKAYSIAVKDDILVHTYAEHGIKMYRMQSDHGLQQICDLTTMQPKIPKYGKKNTLIIGDGLVYRAENTEGISVISINECKVLNTIKPLIKKWTSQIVLTGNTLISFSPLKKEKIYLLKDDMIHEAKKVQYSSKKLSKDSVQVKLSLDQIQTLLYKATTDNNAFEVKRLCQMEANPNVSGHERYTPVEIASRTGKISALKALLECGGKVTKKSMFLAALTEQNEVMKIFEKRGLPVTIKDKQGCTTLHFIAQDGSLEMVKYLIGKGVPYNATCRKDETPLTWANYGNNCKVIDYLETLYPSSHKKSNNKHCREQKIKKEQAREAKIKQLEARKKYEALQEENIRKGIYSPEEQALMKFKMKVKQKGNDLNMKFMVIHPMTTEAMASQRKIPIRFLEHITVFMGERLLFDATLSPYLSNNPMFKIKVKNSVIDEAFTLTAVNNIGYQKSLTLQPKKVHKLPTEMLIPSKENKVCDFKQLSPEMWSAKSVDDAVKLFYGDVLYHEGNIKVTLPEIAGNAAVIPMTIKSDIDLESVAILSNTTEHPLIAVFNVPKGLKIDYNLKFKAKKYNREYVLVIAKGRDGKYYKAIKRLEISHGGDNCS